MIAVNNLTKTYKIGKETIEAVKGVSLAVSKAEMIAIVGHSGSGKTTLLSLIGGLTRPEHGTVAIGGTDIWSISDNALSELRNKKMSFIFQFTSLIPTLNVLENVLLPTLFGKGLSVDYAASLLDKVGLGDRKGSYPYQLSGGQQRRVAIARAFVNDPEIVLADEPTGDLDEETEADMLSLFKSINKEKGVTFIIVTHASDIARQCTKHYVMNKGIFGEKEEGGRLRPLLRPPLQGHQCP
ncbi:MAG: ABC transporter ATP-binding protein [Nitrospirae bacterium]|nr:ABC transporter ATP-binding protein [Nitrospirota bacterium]MBF0592467.1 ABC transporter ATP-binding protein [Nitrospirota bacterium]